MRRELADLTSRTRRGRLYQRVVRDFRRPRLTPHPESFSMFDPAPEWVYLLARYILEHTEWEADAGEKFLRHALTWCQKAPREWSAGERQVDAEARSLWLRDMRDEPEPSQSAAKDTAYLVSLAYKIREVSPPGVRYPIV